MKTQYIKMGTKMMMSNTHRMLMMMNNRAKNNRDTIT
jgi:hypothetical protein